MSVLKKIDSLNKKEYDDTEFHINLLHQMFDFDMCVETAEKLLLTRRQLIEFEVNTCKNKRKSFDDEMCFTKLPGM